MLRTRARAARKASMVRERWSRSTSASGSEMSPPCRILVRLADGEQLECTSELVRVGVALRLDDVRSSMTQRSQISHSAGSCCS
jgi:hypothetical protein